MLKKDQDFSAVMASLSPGQRTAFIILAIGGILPIFFLSAIRPIHLVVAFQMACLTGLAYIRWRSPAFGGSVWVTVVTGLACFASLAAAVMA